MAGRRLDAEERALWRRVIESVRPLDGRSLPEPAPAPPVAVGQRLTPNPPLVAAVPAQKRQETTLDGGWDRRLKRGNVSPERTIDLHGHTLATAHAALDIGLERAIADDVRTLLLITGRAPREGAPPPRRGAIRASVGDWLAASRHAARIAAIRSAHPRHGGAGALYVILRRRKG